MADISVALDLDNSQYLRGIKDAERATTGFSNAAQQGADRAKAAFASLSNVLASIGLAKIVTDSIMLGKTLTSLSQATGLTVESIRGMQNAFVAAGGSAEKASDGLTDLLKNIGEATQNGGELVTAFSKVGVSLSDLQTASEQDILRKVIEGLSKIPDTATRSAVGMKLMGEAVKGVDFTKVNSSIDDYTRKAAGISGSAKAAADAQKNLSLAYGSVTEGVMAGLQPLSESVAKIAEFTEGIRTFVEVAVKIATIAASFFIAGKAIMALRVALIAVGEAGGIMAASFNTVRNVVSQWSLIMQNLISLPIASRLKVIGELIGQIGSWCLKSIPGLTLLTYAFTELYEWVVKGIKAFSEWLGISSKEQDVSKANAEAEKKANEERKRKLVFLEKEKAALDQMVGAYARQNLEANKKSALDTELIGKSDMYKARMTARFDAEKTYLSDIAKLQDQYAQKQAGGADPAELNQISAAMGQLTSEYEKQIGIVDGLAQSNVNATRSEELRLFNIRSLIQAQQQMADLQHEAANIFLPELAKKYSDIEHAANAAANAQIAAEEQRRGTALNDDERLAYYEAARQKVAELQAAEYELEKQRSKWQMHLYTIKEEIDLSNNLNKIKDDMAKMTLPEIEKKYYDIAAAARDSAKAAVEAEEARIGRKLDPEEQKAYYDAANKGVEDLKKLTKEQYDQSRTWSTGWQQAFNEYVENATNAANQARQVFQAVTKGMEDLIIGFAKTGKFEFKSFINDIVEMLLRSEIQRLMAQVFTAGGVGGGGGGGGNFFGTMGKMLGFANGGIIPTNQPVIVGERGPEILTGAAGRTVIPNNQIGGGSTNVTYNIQAVDARSFQQLVAQDPEFIYAVTLKGQRSMPGGR